MADRVERFLEDNADGHGVRDFGAAVEALRVAGVLAADRAEAWKAEHDRLRAAGHGHLGPFDANTEARAIELLEDLFAAVRPSSGDDWDPALYRRYQDALSALTGVGALSLERARPWLSRQSEALTPAGGLPEPEPPPEMAFAAGRLSAVVAGPEQRIEGMRVTCLALYDDCVVVHFHRLLGEPPADPVERRRSRWADLELEDDVGTEYRTAPIPEPPGCKPRRAADWPRALAGWQAFVPGAPLDARALAVGWREHRFRVALEPAT